MEVKKVKPQDVINALGQVSNLRYLAMSMGGAWLAYVNKPNTDFAYRHHHPGVCIAIPDNIFNIDSTGLHWTTALFEYDNRTAKTEN